MKRKGESKMENENFSSLEKRGKRGAFFKGILFFILFVVLAFFLHRYVFSLVEIKGVSMEPTLYEKDFMILDKLSYRFKDIKRFDIVVVKTTKSELIKRVIGLPNEHIEYRENTLYVNGRKVKEPLNHLETTDFDSATFGEDVLPDDCYLVLGDNRMHSTDSRNIGCIPKKYIEGKVTFTVYPLNRIGRKS